MARPRKNGLDYFPFDIDLYQDIKVRKLMRQYGASGACVFTMTLCEIYKNGYYLQLDDNLIFDISEKCLLDEQEVEKIIYHCLDAALFDKSLFDEYHILTSRAIQFRFSYICKQLHRIGGISEYNLIEESEDGVSSEEILVSSQETITRKGSKLIKTRKIISSEEIGVSSEEMIVSSQATAISSEETGVSSLVSTQKKRKEKKEKEKEKKYDDFDDEKTEREIDFDSSPDDKKSPPPDLKIFQEVENLKSDKFKHWRESVARRFGFKLEILPALLLEFADYCVSEGVTCHAKGRRDVQSHFSRWLAKYRPFCKFSISDVADERDDKHKSKGKSHDDLIREELISNQEFRESIAATRGGGDRYIASRGYDPAKVKMYQVLNPNWVKNNPPEFKPSMSVTT